MLKYKQMALGIAWATAQPLSLMVVFTLFTHRLGEPLGPQASYSAFLLSTLVAWTFFQTVVSLGSQGPLFDGGLMQRIYYPREFSVLGWSLASVMDLAIMIPLFFIAAPIVGAKITWTAVFIIPLSLILLMIATGISFFMSAVMIYYRDVRYALPLLMQVWLFASPVAYPLVSIPEEWRHVYLFANPVAGVADGFYWALVAGILPDPFYVFISAAEGLIILIGGYLFFKTLEPNFADVV